MGNVLSARRWGAAQWKLASVGLAAACLVLLSAGSASAASIDLPAGSSAAEADALEVSSYQDDFDVSRQTAEENLEVQSDGAAIAEQLESSQGRRYAGVWFDNESGEFVVPTLADSGRASIAAVASGADLEGDFRTKAVQSSWEELEAAQQRIDDALLALIEERLVGTALDPRTNAVVIKQAGSASGAQRAVIQAAARSESVKVEIRVSQEQKAGFTMEACQVGASICDAPMRGGVDIVPKGGLRGTGCTAGFKATGDANGNRFVLTAGHCVANSGAFNWDSFTAIPEEGRQPLGHVDAYSFPTHDYAAINANGTYWDKASWPTVVAKWGVNQEYQIKNESSSYVGEYVCHVGQQSGLSCGAVTGTHITEPVEDEAGNVVGYVSNLTRFEHICTIGGDSGGPVFAGNIALGLYSGADKPHGALQSCYYNGFYTEITEDTDLLGVHVAPRIPSPPPPPPPPPAQPPVKVGFVDGGNANSLTVWEFGSSGWQQIFLWGHPVAAGTKPFAMTYEGTKHIFFVDASRGNQITEWSWNPTTGWQQAFLNTDPVAAGSSITGYVQSGYANLFFSDAATNRSITAEVRINGAWYPVPFYGDSVAPNSSPSAIISNGQGQIYFNDGSKGNTMAAWTWNSATGWQQSFFYQDTIAANTSPSAIANNNVAEVYFNDASKGNTISVWTWGPGILQQSPFYGDSLAANTSPSAISVGGTPHVYFADGSKSNTIAVWVWTPVSLQQSFFGGDPVATGSSPSATLTPGGQVQVFFSDEATNRSLALWEWGSTLQQIRLYGHLALAGTSPGS